MNDVAVCMLQTALELNKLYVWASVYAIMYVIKNIYKIHSSCTLYFVCLYRSLSDGVVHQRRSSWSRRAKKLTHHFLNDRFRSVFAAHSSKTYLCNRNHTSGPMHRGCWMNQGYRRSWCYVAVHCSKLLWKWCFVIFRWYRLTAGGHCSL